MRDAALAALMLAVGTAACGRTELDELVERPGDASAVDVARDSSFSHADAAVTDGYAGADQTAVTDSYAGADQVTMADSSAADVTDEDAAADASTRDAAEQHLPCDQCSRGDQECSYFPSVCGYNDADVLSCTGGAEGIFTCVAGDAGCAVWAEGVACRSDVPCCAPCMHEYDCPLGSIGDVCEQDTDCALDACDALAHVCITDQCSDHRQDGRETDVDCGGSFCPSCRTGQGCQSNVDCLGGDFCAPSHTCE